MTRLLILLAYMGVLVVVVFLAVAIISRIRNAPDDDNKDSSYIDIIISMSLDFDATIPLEFQRVHS